MKKPCNHYWEIETAAGPDSKGRCKFCRAEKTFANYVAFSTISGHVKLQKAHQENRAANGGLSPFFEVKAFT